MIICHPHKLIFLKTKKTAGTSFEIALSRFCGADCVITPISEVDEAFRQQDGGRGAQAYCEQTWPDGSQGAAGFYNHIPATEAQRLIPDGIWKTYRKVTIVRDPYDVAISRYWREGGDKTGLDFGQFTDQFRALLGENSVIAPLDGSCPMDIYLRYEKLEEDITNLGVEGLWQEFAVLKAKSGHRPFRGTTPAETYKTHPEAAEIVAEECADVIERFHYAAPSGSKPPAPVLSMVTEPLIFTVTAGRTASAWLARFLGESLNIPSIHEPLQPSDFGTEMPDIRTMRMFNNYGMTRHVRSFWNRKLSQIFGPYAETNHTLAKGGLVEALAGSALRERATLVVLRRNLAEQCASYLMRGDFSNVTLEWQWYLSPLYRNIMVNPEPFLPLGPTGRALWYCYEMDVRQTYYIRKFGAQMRIIDARVEEITTPDGARDFLDLIGCDRPAILPPKTNATESGTDAKLAMIREIEKLMAGIEFDASEIADSYIGKGRLLSEPTGQKINAIRMPTETTERQLARSSAKASRDVPVRVI